MFACYLAGPAWRAGRLPSALIHRWAGSREVCWRRAALVSTVPLNVRAQGGEGDPDRTLAVCRLLLGDREDLVVKAMSWALRCLVAWDAPGLRRFLARHQRELAPRVLREVHHKLEIGLKNPRRHA